ncbi:uncharacterized protein Tco025E_04454 [Trypanosoma conorhini]|uniref:Membrane-associated protein n=1 Tax=Trypanosoma conorhini TaxID=83891 RepID=A0A422PMT9_9TRYP|nr:uncharacterized protein Tco025E_04454 [Trypanosoma conorhini]RNF19027.1 hypothetical protein Tco025E_04454 [Trypanosoma conorhini]
MFLIRLVLFSALVLIHLSPTEGTFFAVRGGCIDDPGKWTACVHSAAENGAVVAFLRAQEMSAAGIAGYVQGGNVYWNDGSAMNWKPPGFDPSSAADAGFLVVRSDASWGVLAYDVFPDTIFICTDGEVLPGTTTTTSTEAPATTTTEAPTEAPTNVSEVVDALAGAMSAVGTFDIVPSTTNTVEVPVKATALLHQLDVLRQRHHYFFGVYFAEKGDAVKPQGVSTLMRGTGSTLEFIVPLSLMDLGVRQYLTRVVAVNNLGTSIYRQTDARLLIHSVEEVLQNLKGSVEINEEDMVDGRDIIRPLRVMGPGTRVQHTVAVSPSAFSGLSLTMINHRRVGKACAPSNLPIEFVFANGKLQLFLPREYVERVRTAPRSLCASVAGKHVAIAALEGRRWKFTAAKSNYAWGEPIQVLASGASSAAVASNMYSAFLSHSARCTSVDDGVVSLELETSALPAGGSTSSLPREQQQELTLYLNTASAGKKTGYLCAQHASTGRKIPIVSLAGSRVRVTGELPTMLPSGWVAFFNGSTGSMTLKDVVLPSQSESDVEHFNFVLRLITQNSLRVRFVPLPVGAGWATRLQRCRGNTAGNEMQFAANGGILQMNTPFFPSDSVGVLCAGAEYLRVNYRVYEPLQWLQRFGGSDAAVLSAVLPSLPTSAVRLSVTNWDVSAHFAVRLAVDGRCHVGFTANVWQASDAAHAVSFPNTVSGTFTLCVGVYTAAGGTSMFVSTDRKVFVISYETGLKAWKKEQEVLSGTWTPCGASSVCGYVSPQPFLEVCGRQTVTHAWPSIVTEMFYSLGSLSVKLRGEAQIYPGALVEDRVFVKREKFSCQNLSRVEVSGDGHLYSTSAVINQAHSVVSLKPSTPLAGVVLGFATWDEGCDSTSIRHKVLVSTVAPAAGPVSALDLVSLLGGREEMYFVVCVLQATSWRTVSQTHIHAIPSGAEAKSVGADAIATLSPNEHERLLYLWQTGTEEWNIVGSFLPNVAMSLALVWDNASCHASPAYAALMRYVSPTTALVRVEASFIAAAPTPTSLLYPCYSIEGAPALPLRIEQRRKRCVVILNLSLSSLNYLPHFAIRYNTTEYTTIIFSDPLNAPITQLELFLLPSPVEAGAATSCSPTAQRHVLSLLVQVNEFGLRYVTIAPSVPAMLGSAGREVYLRLCATASKGVSPSFVQVSAYLVVNSIGSVTQPAPFSLELVFLSLNNTGHLLPLPKCAESVKRYVVDATGWSLDQRGILITSKGNNRFLLFIEPTLEVTGEDATKQLRAVYRAMASGKHLPLRVSYADGLWFVLCSVEGVHLFNQTPYDELPRVVVTGLDAANGAYDGDLTKQTITIFCIVIVPVVVGFVVFSLQRTVPRLSLPNLGKGWLKQRNGNGRGTRAKAAHNAVFAVLDCEGPDSPPPRIPHSMETDVHRAALAAENSAAGPLYDSDGDEAPTSLGCTPPPPPPLPVGNATFSFREHGAGETSRDRNDEENA